MPGKDHLVIIAAPANQLREDKIRIRDTSCPGQGVKTQPGQPFGIEQQPVHIKDDALGQGGSW